MQPYFLKHGRCFAVIFSTLSRVFLVAHGNMGLIMRMNVCVYMHVYVRVYFMHVWMCSSVHVYMDGCVFVCDYKCAKFSYVHKWVSMKGDGNKEMCIYNYYMVNKLYVSAHYYYRYCMHAIINEKLDSPGTTPKMGKKWNSDKTWLQNLKTNENHILMD